MKKIYFLLLFLSIKLIYLSNVGITAPSLSITTCTFPSSYSTLGDIVIDEGANGDFATGVAQTLILTAPANFEFNPGVGTLSQNGGAVNLSALAMVVTSSTITITYTSGGTNRDDILTISGIQLRGITAASSGNILRTVGNPGSGSIAGITNGATSFGSLTSVVGCGCNHTIRLTDTFGDGWNSGTVKVQVNGVDVLTNLTFATGFGPTDFTFLASTSDVIRVIETNAGSFPTEMRAQVLDGGGTSIIAVHDPTTGAGTSGTGNCPPPMVITAAVVTQSNTSSVLNCGANQEIVRLEITTTGATSPKTVTQIQTNFAGTAATSALSNVDIYYTGTSSSFATTSLFGSNASPSTSTYNINGSQALVNGVNYFWLVYDLNNSGTVGTTIDGLITQFTASAVNYNSGSTPNISTTNPAGSRTIAICTGPGGVTTGLSHWVKSDAGVTGSPVTSWADNSSAQILGNLNTLGAGFSPSVQVGTINYQNYIRFDGVDDGLKSANTVTAVTSGLFSNSENSIFMVKNNRQVGGGAFGAQVDFKWESAASGNYRVGFEVETTNQRFDFVNDVEGKNTVSTTPMIGVNRIVSVLTQATSSSISVNGLADATKNHGTSLSLAGAGGTTKSLFLGCNDNSAFPIFADVDIAEEIIFNNRLNATDQLKVESYLAVKYGQTLGNATTPSNYIASNATTTWTGLAAFQNNVIGLGRDDNASLFTKQSHQADDTVRIYMNALQATNAANTANFTLDRSFVIQGSDNRKLCSTASAMTEIPSGLTNCAITSRLEREWKVTRTNMAQTYNMDVKLNACGAPGSVNVAHLRLLVDDDGNFGNGGTQCYYNGDGTGLVFTYSNPTITVSNISTTHIPNNGSKFITIASINPATPLPIEIIYFDAKLNQKKTVDLTWETLSERDNDYFTIDKSTDGVNWEYLGTIDGSGTTVIPQNYYLEHKNPAWGINYYRLKQTDFNGLSSYIDIKTVELKIENQIFAYPNPANNKVQLVGKDIASKELEIINNLGQKVSFEKKFISSDHIEISTEHLANGIYYLRFTNESLLNVQKLIITHLAW